MPADEILSRDRLQPFLLDRLIDDRRDQTQEARDSRIVNTRQLHRAVLRDLEWLLNASSHPQRDELSEYPNVAKSVLNYGIPDLCGVTASSMNADALQQMLIQAIHQFEPRIVKYSLNIVPIVSDEVGPGNAIRFDIRGEVWAVPMPDAMYLKTEVDLESGHCSLQDKLHG